jgi:carbon storage regulator CsrA
MMLVLKRRLTQIVQIGPDITITVVGIESGAVVLGISAPAETQITRVVTVALDSPQQPGPEGTASAPDSEEEHA